MNMKLPQSLHLRLPEFRRVAVTLVGCGGTGSHIASGLVSIAQALAEKGIGTDILFIDPDVVEPKNVGRQLFSQADVGRPKAQVLAERLNAAFATTVGCAVRKVDTLDKFGAEDDRVADDARNKLCVVVGAVDTASARKVIAANVRAATGRVWWLDCGNENHSGQVALGNSFGKIERRMGLVTALPAPSVVYPDLVKTHRAKRATRAQSCAELQALGVQGLMVNRMMAAWACAMLHDFLLGELRYIAVTFDLAHGNARALPLDVETLAGVGVGK